MLKSLLERWSGRFLSRWIILAFDTLMVSLLFPLAVMIRYNFEVDSLDVSLLHERNLVVCLVYLVAFLYTGAYKGIIRQTGLRDAYLIFKATGIAFVGLFIISWIRNPSGVEDVFNLPRSILVVHFLLSLFLLLSFRFIIKSTYNLATKQTKSTRRTRVMIFGSGAAGEITRQSLSKEVHLQYDIVGYIDDNPTKHGKIQDGIKVYSREQVLNHEFMLFNRVHQLIIAIQNLPISERNALIKQGMSLNLKVKVVPPVRDWIHGQLTTRQIKDVRIEDLLERDTISLDSVNVVRELSEKVIMVTGAAGSIGSEILRQVLHYSPAKVIAIDQAESALYEVEMDLLHNRTNHHGRTDFVIADITREERMEKLFEQYNPEIIFHAAAYKHVPLMEAHPYEAVKVNVFGTKTVVDLAVRFGVEKFVMVSTDKAVNPTNVMGASKRIAEMYVQSFCKDQYDTKFITTRFGNVLGSNGSVIPLFRKQIGRGGPVTITHPDITRYFMTIPEACNLVLEAGAMGSGGEIFVFDMGESVKIADLARNMIRLSGLELGQDIEIKYTGLRPGEKLYEELLATNEGTRPTHHDKIMIADIRHVDKEHIEYMLKAMHEALNTAKPEELVRLMKQMVKEFKSNNSIFAKLD